MDLNDAVNQLHDELHFENVPEAVAAVPIFLFIRPTEVVCIRPRVTICVAPDQDDVSTPELLKTGFSGSGGVNAHPQTPIARRLQRFWRRFLGFS